MRRALVLAYHFPPVGGSGVQRNAKFVRYLPEHGYEPVVVTGTGTARGRWTPADETLLRELPPGTEVHRVAGPEGAHREGVRGRLERIAGVHSPYLRWWIDGAVELGARVGGDADLVYASLAPYETAEAAARLASRLGKPWVADLQDPWALDEIWLYPTALHRRRDLRRMGRLLATAAAVVVNTPEAERRMRDAFPQLADRVVAIPNGFDAEDFAGPAPSRNGRFRIVHTGYLYTEAGLRHRRTGRLRLALGGAAGEVDILPRSHVYLLRALESLDPELTAGLEVHLAGELTDADREAAAGSSHVRMHGYVTHERAVELMRGADLLFLPLHDVAPGARVGIVPGKTYEYLASGRPILAAVPAGDARDLVGAADGTHVVDPSDAGAMAQVIAAAIARREDDSARGTLLAPYERRHLTRRLADVFDSII